MTGRYMGPGAAWQVAAVLLAFMLLTTFMVLCAVMKFMIQWYVSRARVFGLC